jgi:uncharacterized membrane protein YfcA
MGSLEIEVDVNESYINRVVDDQRIVATLDAYPDWDIPGAVITTVPAADRQRATVLVRILGVMMLLFVVYTRLPIGREFNMKLWGFVPLGAGTGFGSAFLGIPGPFAAVFYLAYGLTASAYIGTSALGMGMIQVPKLIIFGSGDLITVRVLALGIGLGAIAAVSAVLGRVILRRVPEHVFPRIITAMLLISGVVFLIRG